MTLDEGPIDRARERKGRKRETLFREVSYLVRGININVIFSWTTLQDPLDQDKSRRVFTLFMVGDLVW